MEWEILRDQELLCLRILLDSVTLRNALRCFVVDQLAVQLVEGLWHRVITFVPHESRAAKYRFDLELILPALGQGVN